MKRTLVIPILALLSAALPQAGISAQAAAPAAAASGTASYLRLGPGRHFNLGDLPRASAAAPAAAHQFHPANPGSYAAAKAHPSASGARHLATSSAIPRVSVARPQAGSPPSLFPLISHDQEADVEPPDTSVAAGLNWGMEMVNVVGRVFDESSGASRSAVNFDLAAFFNVPGTSGWFFSDPRVFYDRVSGRWLASGMAYHQPQSNSPNIDAGQVYVAISAGSDPGNPGTLGSGGWIEWKLYDNSSGSFCDQPQLGFSSDKVVVACVEFPGNGNPPLGQRIFVLNKAAMIQGQSLVAYQRPLDASISSVVPAVTLGPGSDEWMTYHNPNASTLGVMRLSGNVQAPAQGSLNVQSFQLLVGGYSVPPGAAQPLISPTSPTCATSASSCIDTGDDRLMTTVWQGGLLWTAGDDACTPGGDTAVRSCLRLLQVDTRGASPVVAQNGDYAIWGKYLYYPAVTLDAFGDAFFSFSLSSSVDNPALAVVDEPAGSASFSQPAVLQSGVAPYTDDKADPQFGMRWGDYSAATQDPCVPNQVMMAGEYVASATNRGWGTAAAKVSDRASPMQSMSTSDAFGAIHAEAGCPVEVPALWPNWKISNGAAWQVNAPGGYILDGYGGLHAFGGAPPVRDEAYWGGWNIARDVALLPVGGQGYTLDGWGGLHPFGGAPAPRLSGFWPNWDIAKRVVILSDGTGGYVMDGWGGLHEFAVGANPMPQHITNEAYWPNWNIARGIALTPNATATGVSGLTLDGFGGVHPFGSAGAVSGEAIWGGWDIARDVTLVPNSTAGTPQGYTLDGWGGVHEFGGAPHVQGGFYSPNQDIGRRLAALSVLQG